MNVFAVTLVKADEKGQETRRGVRVLGVDVEQAIVNAKKIAKQGERVLEAQRKFALDG